MKQFKLVLAAGCQKIGPNTKYYKFYDKF